MVAELAGSSSYFSSSARIFVAANECFIIAFFFFLSSVGEVFVRATLDFFGMSLFLLVARMYASFNAVIRFHTRCSPRVRWRILWMKSTSVLSKPRARPGTRRTGGGVVGKGGGGSGGGGSEGICGFWREFERTGARWELDSTCETTVLVPLTVVEADDFGRRRRRKSSKVSCVKNSSSASSSFGVVS